MKKIEPNVIDSCLWCRYAVKGAGKIKTAQGDAMSTFILCGKAIRVVDTPNKDFPVQGVHVPEIPDWCPLDNAVTLRDGLDGVVTATTVNVTESKE